MAEERTGPLWVHPARLEAMAAGAKRYASDVPCAKHPQGIRYCCNTQCVECVADRAAKRAALRPPKPPTVKPFRNKAEAAKRRKEVAEFESTRLPLQVRAGLAGYLGSDTQRANSKYLDGLLKAMVQS